MAGYQHSFLPPSSVLIFYHHGFIHRHCSVFVLLLVAFFVLCHVTVILMPRDLSLLSYYGLLLLPFAFCTYVLLCTYGLCYFAFTGCVIITVVALFALHCYSAIFIAKSVRNELIHSFIHSRCVQSIFHRHSLHLPTVGWPG